MLDYAHLKSNDQFVALTDLKLHALWASLDMYDHTHLNLHNQFITLIDMKLHALKLYMSLYFWDLKILIVSLGMPT